jgi:hypothetical protein
MVCTRRRCTRDTCNIVDCQLRGTLFNKDLDGLYLADASKAIDKRLWILAESLDVEHLLAYLAYSHARVAQLEESISCRIELVFGARL